MRFKLPLLFLVGGLIVSFALLKEAGNVNFSSRDLQTFSSNFFGKPKGPRIEGALTEINNLGQLRGLAGDSSTETIDVKFLIRGFGTKEPHLYFLNADKHPWHYQLAEVMEKRKLNKGQFSVDCLGQTKGYVCGFLKYIPEVARDVRDFHQKRYLWYLYHNDAVDFAGVEKIHELIEDALPSEMLFDFIGSNPPQRVGDNSWMPVGERQIIMAGAPELSKIHRVFSHQLLQKGEEKILNEGFTVGTLRRVSNETEIKALNHTDLIVLDLDNIPLELPPVAGVISKIDQHQLSHINLLSKNRGTPNVYIEGVLEKDNYMLQLGKRVKFFVRQNQVKIIGATDDEFEKFWSQKRPKKLTTLTYNDKIKDIVDLKSTQKPYKDLLKISGAKASNLSLMSKIKEVSTPEFLLSIPFYWYDQHTSAILKDFTEKLGSSKMELDFEFREKTLKSLRSAIKKKPLDPIFLKEVKSEVAGRYDSTKPIRFRSSSNSEDLDFFNGAGLYDSKTGYFKPSPELKKKTLERAIKKVWASVWNLQAYQERSFFRIDHFSSKMAVLVQPSYPSAREKSNGVALISRQHAGRWLVSLNLAEGDKSITNPDFADKRATEVVEVVVEGGVQTISNVQDLKLDKIVSLDEIKHLSERLVLVGEKIGPTLSSKTDKLDFEFKWVDADRRLVVKQVRPLKLGVKTFNGFDGGKTKSKMDLSDFYSVSYNSCSSEYFTYVEENGNRIYPDPYTAHLELQIIKDMPQVALKKGQSFEFINAVYGIGVPDGNPVFINHPFMHHGPYDLVLESKNGPIQSFKVPALGSRFEINGVTIKSPVQCQNGSPVYTNWPKTLEREVYLSL